MSLILQNIHVQRGPRRVLSDVTARIEAGRVIGVVGPNGAGKSTLLSAIAGDLPFRGRITWEGCPIEPSLVGYMPQVSHVRASLSVLETVLLGRHAFLGWRVRASDIDRAEVALAAFGLVPLASRAMNTLSGGQQQMVLLAQRLARDPRILVLDEATSALDLCHQMMVMAHVRWFARTRRATVIIALHDLNLAVRHADELLLVGPDGSVSHGDAGMIVTKDTLRRVYGIEADILVGPGDRPMIVPVALAEGENEGRAGELRGDCLNPPPASPGASS
ncbi:MAG: ABC transporter ATP-binding protein [Rhodospirillum sp.]|nr:ABC transporter ATP-binding protein [Rhodospirillum sp.]MCF8491168.1 ABC transporter ATP-binding protein [Rhodospirillum sp.]MCF8502500.1 ABC transporter ATP-binding protein [Rhodospirillum sp.]